MDSERINPSSQAIEIIKQRKVLMNPLYRLWHGFPEPKIITFLQSLMYVIVLAYGSKQLISEHRFEDENITVGLGIVVALTFVVGGLVAVFSTPKGYWQFERGGIILIATGFIIHLGWTLVDPAPGVDLGQTFRIAVCILALMIRYSSISWARMDPEK